MQKTQMVLKTKNKNIHTKQTNKQNKTKHLIFILKNSGMICEKVWDDMDRGDQDLPNKAS